jgi:hypothetical protein
MAYNLGQTPQTPPYPGATYALPAVPGGPGGGWNPAPLSGYASPSAAGGNAAGEAELARRRGLLDTRFASIYGMQQPMADGSDPAFSQAVQQRLLGQATDAGFGQQRSNERLLRQGFRSNMGGALSGGEMQAIMDSRRQVDQDTWARRAGLETTFELENRNARERGIQSMLATLGLELPYQSRFEVMGSDPLSEAFARMLAGGGQVRQASGGGGGGGGGAAAQEPWDWRKGHPEYGFTYVPPPEPQGYNPQYRQPEAPRPSGPFTYGGVYRRGEGGY